MTDWSFILMTETIDMTSNQIMALGVEKWPQRQQQALYALFEKVFKNQ